MQYINKSEIREVQEVHLGFPILREKSNENYKGKMLMTYIMSSLIHDIYHVLLNP